MSTMVSPTIPYFAFLLSFFFFRFLFFFIYDVIVLFCAFLCFPRKCLYFAGNIYLTWKNSLSEPCFDSTNILWIFFVIIGDHFISSGRSKRSKQSMLAFLGTHTRARESTPPRMGNAVLCLFAVCCVNKNFFWASTVCPPHPRAERHQRHRALLFHCRGPLLPAEGSTHSEIPVPGQVCRLPSRPLPKHVHPDASRHETWPWFGVGQEVERCMGVMGGYFIFADCGGGGWTGTLARQAPFFMKLP